MKKINIDGSDWINKYHYDKLLKKKIPEKEKELLDFKKYSIPEACNVCAIIPLDRDTTIEDKITISIGTFKEIEDLAITYFHDKEWNVETLKIRNTKFSKEFLDKMKKVAKPWCGEDIRIFMKINDKEEFEDDFPAIFLFGDTLAFLLAPRVDD